MGRWLLAGVAMTVLVAGMFWGLFSISEWARKRAMEKLSRPAHVLTRFEECVSSGRWEFHRDALPEWMGCNQQIVVEGAWRVTISCVSE